MQSISSVSSPGATSTAEQRAHQARYAPLLMVPWLIVSFVVAMWVLGLFDWEPDTEFPDRSAGQAAFDVVFDFLFVPLPLIGGFLMARWARLRGAAAAAKRALWINGGLLVAWWVLNLNAILQDYFGY